MKLPVLVIGGGISGITAAVELAEAGQEVVLIEKEPYLGGHVSLFNNYFPKLCPPSGNGMKSVSGYLTFKPVALLLNSI